MGKAQHVVLLQLLHGVYNAEVGFSAKSQAGLLLQSPEGSSTNLSSLPGRIMAFVHKEARTAMTSLFSIDL